VSVFERLRNKQILLVDDDEWIRNSMSLLFENEGCRLTAAGTAEEGLTMLKNQTFDIIITDYQLPGINGLEFLRRINTSQADVPKILITAYGNASITSKALALGVKKVIEKPITTALIEKTLSGLIH